MGDDDVAAIRDGGLTLHRRKKKDQTNDGSRTINRIDLELHQIMKGQFDSFMQKEIFEQPESVVNSMRGRVVFDKDKVVLGGLIDHISEMKRCRRIILIACGTSYHSCMATRQLIEEMTELPVMLELASDFLDRKTPIFRNDVCFFISQSGETADTLMALRYCKKRGALTVGITNTVGSSVSRETNCGVHVNAGPEIGVASTKAYTSQVVALLIFAVQMAADSIARIERCHSVIASRSRLPTLTETLLANVEPRVAAAAGRFKDAKSMLLVARGSQTATVMEGALKIKELTYIH